MAILILSLNQSESVTNLEQLVTLAGEVFEDIEPAYVEWRIKSMPDVTTFVAEESGQWLGFKCGYAMTRRCYYSWLGGVDPRQRRSGIAGTLMQAQHEWVRDSGYEIVETHVRQDNLAMVQTNLKFGFKIVGRFLKSDQVNLIL